jgi:hypothetical protein
MMNGREMIFRAGDKTLCGKRNFAREREREREREMVVCGFA